MMLLFSTAWSQADADDLWSVYASGETHEAQLEALHHLFYQDQVPDSLQALLAAKEYALASTLERTDLQADARFNLGYHYLRSEMLLDSAFRLFQQAKTLLQKSPNDTIRYKLDQGFGEYHYRKGHLDSSEFYFQKALNNRGYEAIDPDRVRILNWLGEIHNNRGNCGQAMPLYARSLRISETLKDSMLIARTHEFLGNCSLDSQDPERALKEYRYARSIYAAIGSDGGQASVLGMIGFILLDQNNPDTAIATFQESLRLARRTENRYNVSYALLWLGMAYEQTGDLEKAERCLKEQFDLISALGDKMGILDAHAALSDLYDEMGKTGAAIENAEKALQYAMEVDHVGRSINMLLALSRLYRETGQYQLALDRLELGKILDDSIVREENKRGLLRQEYQYTYAKKAFADSLDFAKKEELAQLEIEKRDANLAKQRIGLMAAGGGVFLLGLLAYSIRRGKRRSDELLLNILPEEVADELKAKGHSDAQLIEEVTVLFTDFKGFTALSEQVTPKALVADLHECFSAFDRICGKHGIEKIKTIGDAYMAAGGLPSPNGTHAHDVVRAALEMAKVIETGKAKKIRQGLPYFEIRIGIHTGPVVAGIVGVKKFQYDIWGDTVNTASRMESSGSVGKVNISDTTYTLLKDDPSLVFEQRGKIEAKGKGFMNMYFVRSTVG